MTAHAIKHSADELIRRYPGFAMFLSALVPGITLTVFNEAMFACAVFVSMIFVIAAWCVYGSGKALAFFAIPSFLMLCSILIMRSAQEDNPLTDILGENTRSARICATFMINDPSAGGDSTPQNIRCLASSISFPYSDETFVLSKPVPVMIRFKKDLSFPSPRYGDIFEAEGIISRPEKPLLDCEFDYSKELARNGIDYVFRVDSFRMIGSESSFMRLLYDIRSNALNSVFRYIPSSETKAFGSGLFFGIRQGIDRETKNDFLNSGAIHILTVSGTHVALFLGVMLMILRFLPLRARYIAAFLFVAVYVLSTGMRPPAFRAFVMAGTMLSLRVFYYKTDTLNSLFLAGVILLFIDPANITSAGFQYSFTVVCALLVAMPFISGVLDTMYPSLSFIPSRYIPLRRLKRSLFVKRFIAGGLIGCTIAFMAALPLGLYYQNILPASGILANFLLIPAAMAAFLLFFIALIVSAIPFLGAFTASLLGMILDAMTSCAEFFSSGAVTSFAKITVVFVLVYYFFFFGFLIISKTYFRIICGGALCGLLIFAGMRKYFFEDEILFIYGGSSNVPVLVLTENRLGRAFVVNMPDFAMARSVSSYLNSRGITRCSMILSGRTKPHYGGIDYFAIPILELAADPLVFKNMKNNVPFYGTRLSDGNYEAYPLKFTSGRDIFIVSIHGDIYKVRILENGGCEISFSDTGSDTEYFPLSSRRISVKQRRKL